MISFTSFYQSVLNTPLEHYLSGIASELEQWQAQAHPDLKRWMRVISTLPRPSTQTIDLLNQVKIGQADDINDTQLHQITTCLQLLKPWRKGPFNLFDIAIDAEWRSNLKWDRIKSCLNDIKNASVLDVGCGNGYYMFRMLGLEAKQIIGVDPMDLYLAQFMAIKCFLPHYDHAIHFLPLKAENLPFTQCFDYVFSMGVLGHRRSPIDHLLLLKSFLKPKGKLILETLVINGNETDVLMPPDRYANMNNIWFIPSIKALTIWLNRCRFSNVELLDATPTTVEEQRSTAWCNPVSLIDSLDIHDKNRTKEGLPVPMRASFIVTA